METKTHEFHRRPFCWNSTVRYSFNCSLFQAPCIYRGCISSDFRSENMGLSPKTVKHLFSTVLWLFFAKHWSLPATSAASAARQIWNSTDSGEKCGHSPSTAVPWSDHASKDSRAFPSLPCMCHLSQIHRFDVEQFTDQCRWLIRAKAIEEIPIWV